MSDRDEDRSMSFEYDDEFEQPEDSRSPRTRGDSDLTVRPRSSRGRRTGAAQSGGYSRNASRGTTASQSSRYAQLKLEDANRRKKKRRIIAMIVAECIVLACIFSYAYVSRLWNLMPKPSVKKRMLPILTLRWRISIRCRDTG